MLLKKRQLNCGQFEYRSQKGQLKKNVVPLMTTKVSVVELVLSSYERASLGHVIMIVIKHCGTQTFQFHKFECFYYSID